MHRLFQRTFPSKKKMFFFGHHGARYAEWFQGREGAFRRERMSEEKSNSDACFEQEQHRSRFARVGGRKHARHRRQVEQVRLEGNLESHGERTGTASEGKL